LNISLPSFFNRESELGDDGGAFMGRVCAIVFSIRRYATVREIAPLNNSTISTAVPAEYASEGVVDTLE